MTLGVAAWAAVVATAFAGLVDYSLTPGESIEPPRRWPPSVTPPPSPRLPTLVLVCHPQCPCTAASIGELDRIAARTVDRLAIRVLFVPPRARPEGRPDAWARSALWRRAAAIPHVAVRSDPEGEAARAFGARTSGTALLFDRDGALVFYGGITASRGHEGDNVGAAAIVAFAVDGAIPDAEGTPTFGCELFDREPAEAEAR